MSQRTVAASSFRDNAGFVFFESGEPFRQVNEPYREHYEFLKASGLTEDLHRAGLLVPHEEVPFRPEEFPGAIAVLKPETIPFLSYPYEWCFSELKDAALCTLEIQQRALKHGMVLKDASAYNIQFLRGRPVLIDSLSLEKYVEGEPWIAYGQFCRHFLAPLALIAKVDPFLGRLCSTNVDGIPMEVASKILKGHARWRMGLQMHIHLHAKAVEKVGEGGPGSSAKRISKTGLMGLIDSLKSTVSGLRWEPKGTVWAEYYSNTNYSPSAMEAKRRIVSSMLEETNPRIVWDLGSNTGEFSDIALEMGASVVAWDFDPAAVERHYLRTKSDRQENVLPLIQDLANPSPYIGWALHERDSFVRRANAHLVMALALIHHLAIGNNVPFGEQAQFFARLGQQLIIEFVPKEDSQVQKMLASRKDVFDLYDQRSFERAFGEEFRILRADPVPDSRRTIYLMERHH